MKSILNKVGVYSFIAYAITVSFVAHGATPTQAEILEQASESDWRIPDQANLLYMKIPQGQIVFELAPEFAPEHVKNIKILAQEKYWDNLSVYRVQDNFVAQFGDPNAMDSRDAPNVLPLGGAKSQLPVEFDTKASSKDFWQLPDIDGWAPQVGFSNGFPVGRDTKLDKMWLAHCYGLLGAGRFAAKDSSTGAELYMVIGQSPRQIDLNITSVGRVILGAEFLSALKRGTGPAGIYETTNEYTPIEWIRLGSQLPVEQQIHLEILKTNTPVFEKIVEAKRNRIDDFYGRPAGHIDLCNITVPYRVTTSNKAAN